MSPYLSRHVDNDDPRHYAFMRDSKIPHGAFSESLGERIQRWGNRAVGVAMSLVAIFLVLGLAFGWFQ